MPSAFRTWNQQSAVPPEPDGPFRLLCQGYHGLGAAENRFVCYNMRTARSGRLTQRNFAHLSTPRFIASPRIVVSTLVEFTPTNHPPEQRPPACTLGHQLPPTSPALQPGPQLFPEDTMQRKCGKYLADWRDATGIRHRKAFPTEREALDFLAQIRAQGDASKNASAQRHPSRKPLRSGRARSLTTRTRGRHLHP